MPMTINDQSEGTITLQKIDGFLKIADIPGTSTRTGHTDQIEIHSMKMKVYTPTLASSGRHTGRSQVSTLTVSKYVDKTTPQLIQAQLQNKDLGDATFYARRVVDIEPIDYFAINLTKTRVVGVQIRPSLDMPDVLEEIVDLAGAVVTWTANPDGVEFTYDVLADAEG